MAVQCVWLSSVPYLGNCWTAAIVAQSMNTCSGLTVSRSNYASGSHCHVTDEEDGIQWLVLLSLAQAFPARIRESCNWALSLSIANIAIHGNRGEGSRSWTSRHWLYYGPVPLVFLSLRLPLESGDRRGRCLRVVWGWLPTHPFWKLSCWFTLQDASFSLAHTLSGHPGLTNSRFGFAMAALGDINQDKFTDVAIGAPLEGFGAGDGASYGSVYIYNGHSDGLYASPSQVTMQGLSCFFSGVQTSHR